MEFTHLGRSGLSVSRLCLGTMNFGPLTTEADSHSIMDSAHDQGINFFDTANVYGQDKGKGATETIVGNWFAKGGGRRERTVLATKLYGDMGDWPNEGKLSALNIRRALDASLKRLQTDHIDLYQFHHVDRRTPWEEIWQAIEVAVAQGKILYVGSSNFAGWHIAQAQAAAAERHFTGLVSEQSIYNLASRATSSWRSSPPPSTSGWASSRGRRSTVGCWAAYSRRTARASVGCEGGQPTRLRRTASRSRPTRTSPTSSATSRATSPWPGCCTSRPSPRRSSARARRSSSTRPSAPSTSTWTTRRSRDWTRSSPVTATAPEHYAW